MAQKGKGSVSSEKMPSVDELVDVLSALVATHKRSPLQLQELHSSLQTVTAKAAAALGSAEAVELGGPQKPVPLTAEQRAKAAEAAAAVVMVPEPDPLTAEQRAEKAREAEAIAEEVDAPSKAPDDDQQWDKNGCSALKAALKNTVLPDAAYLVQLADEGGILPRNQDLPPGSRVTLADMEKWTIDDMVGALIISYPW